MAENEVKIIVTTDSSGAVSGVETAAGATGALGETADKAGKKGSESFHVMGQASGKLAEALGMPARAAHTLGSTVDGLAQRSFPGWSMALNVSAVAVTAVVMGIMYLAGKKRELAEATEKQVAQLRSETEAMYQYMPQSEAMRIATYNLTVAKKEQLKVKLAERIIDETDAYEEQIKRITKLNESFNEKESYTHNELVAMQQTQKELRNVTAEANVLEKQLIADKELLKSLSVTPAMGQTFEPDAGRYDDQVEAYRTFLQNKQYAALMDFEFNKRINESAMEYDNTRLEFLRAEALAEIEIERQKQAAIRSYTLTFYQGQLNIVSQALDAYVAVTGKRNAVIFAAQKALGIAQIWVDTQRAAMAAAASVAGIPVVGPAMAAAAYAEMQTLGQISMAIAAAAALGQLATGTWSGGGGGGGGSIGTFPASPGTGLPSQNAEPSGQRVSITIITRDPWGGDIDRTMEEILIPAINAAGDRNITINAN